MRGSALSAAATNEAKLVEKSNAQKDLLHVIDQVMES
jgi:hypothetical protein